MHDEIKEALYNGLVEDDEISLNSILKDLFIERLERKAYSLYAEEIKTKQITKLTK